jgi:hypothetical protein
MSTASPGEVIGVAKLARMVFEGAPIEPLFERLKARAQAAPDDAGAIMDLATLLLLTGQKDVGVGLQAQAIAMQPAYVRRAAGEATLRLLAFVAPGDLMANTPLDFLLEDADVDLISVYVEPDRSLPVAPAHDVAFLAIGESEANQLLLAALEAPLAAWPARVFNGVPRRIRELTRDGVSKQLSDAAGIVAPRAVRMTRTELAALSSGACPPVPYPLLVRPIASHAGAGLARLETPAAISPYLIERPEPLYYLCPFIDYAGRDGLFRKQRVAVIDGRPFICHLAVSDHWMVHYLNAGMAENPVRRTEEAAFMAGFDSGFAARQAGALALLHDRLGLDYFGIDCAELDDGRLLLFEADTAMIVHAMDPPDLFAYKAAPMRKLFAAFEAMLRSNA